MIATPPIAEIIRNEATLYERLFVLLHEEEEALVAGRTAAVADCVTRKENLVLEIRLAEIARQSALFRLARESEDRAASLDDDPELAEARERLREILPRVQLSNRRVAALLDRALARLQATLEILHESVGPGRRYRADGGLVSALPSTVDGKA